MWFMAGHEPKCFCRPIHHLTWPASAGQQVTACDERELRIAEMRSQM
jgi:hypothetical protein